MEIIESFASEGHVSYRRSVATEFILSMGRVKLGQSDWFAHESILNRISQSDLIISLEELISDLTFSHRNLASSVLLNLDDENQVAVNLFIDLLNSGNLMDVIEASQLLASCSLLPENLKSRLEQFLSHKNYLLRVSSAAALARYSPAAIPILGRAIREDNLIEIERALASLDSSNFLDSANAMRQAAIQTAELLSSLAASSLGRAGIRCDESIRLLTARIKEAQDTSQARIIYLLSNFGNHASGATALLADMILSSQTPEPSRRAAAYAIGKIAGNTKASQSLVKPLVKAINRSDWVTAINISSSFATIGYVPKSATIALARLLEFPSAIARSNAAVCLGKLGADPKHVFPLILKSVQIESNRQAWESMAACVASLGKSVIPNLIEIIEDDDLRLMPFAGECLLRIGVDCIELLAHTMLSHYDGRVRRHLALILSFLGPHAEEAIPSILKLLDSEDTDIRFDAIIALNSIGTEVPEATPYLVKALDDPCIDIAHQAFHIIKKFSLIDAENYEQHHLTCGSQGRGYLSNLNLRRKSLRKPEEADLSWVGNDVLLMLFVEIARIIDDRGPTSFREMASILAERKAKGELDNRIPTNYSTVTSQIEKLEKLISLKESKAIKLIDRSNNRKGGLSNFGVEFSIQAIKYLKQID